MKGSVRNWFLAHVARPRPAQAFVPQIDGLRFVAIGVVILFHVRGYVAAMSGVPAEGFLYRLFEQGYYGVPLFFALSGYIIACQFLGPKKVDLRRYFIRRITRLEPPYVISMLLVFAIKLWVLDMAFPALLPNLLASLVYLHNLLFVAHSKVNGVAWSLEIEWQFYVLAPLAFALILRTPGLVRHAGLWIVILLGGAAFAFGDKIGPRFEMSLLYYFGFFAAGIWVAVMDAGTTARKVSWRSDALGLASGGAIVYALLLGGSASAALPALTGILVLCALRGPVMRSLLGWWPVHCIGAMCYTIYLYHFFVVSAVGQVFASTVGWSESADVSLILFSLVAVPVVIAACLVPYLLIERPFMVWRPGSTRLVDAFRTQPT